jgi:hypothetical protein
MGSGGIAPPFWASELDGGEWLASRPGRFIPGEIASVPIGWEAGRAPGTVWTLWKREKSYTYWELNPGCPAHSQSL